MEIYHIVLFDWGCKKEGTHHYKIMLIDGKDN